jgi:hypothetical protein
MMRGRGADTTIRLNRAAVHVTEYMIYARRLCPITMATRSSKRLPTTVVTRVTAGHGAAPAAQQFLTQQAFAHRATARDAD